MPVIVMTVNEVKQHPNADSLRVYQMSAPAYNTVQIIANLENTYGVGDRVAVALADSTLKDGTKIKPTKLRGLSSFGMALGCVQEAVGADLSGQYCQQDLTQTVKFQAWPSIELLHNLCRNFEAVGEFPTLTYRAKVKLDGTNAGIQLLANGQVAAQSRTQLITPQNDNMGFANWVDQNQSFFAGLGKKVLLSESSIESTHAAPELMTIFGEWCGDGIQNRTAISRIGRKVFAVFAIQYGGSNGHVAHLDVDPDNIRAVLPDHPDIFILPFYGDAIALDFSNKDQLKAHAEQLSQWVDNVEQVDPWVKDNFGIEGLGEGLVFYPVTETDQSSKSVPPIERLGYSELLFKAKGLKHHVVKVKKPVQVAPEKVKEIQEFVTLSVTPARLEQGVTEACNGEFNMTKMGEFLKWFTCDVEKESQAELEQASLTWKEVNKAVMNAARDWYKNQTMSLR